MSVRNKADSVFLPPNKKKVYPLDSGGTSEVSSDSSRKTQSDTWRWPCCVCVRARVRVCKRARACDYKGRIWDALGKTNTDSDRCQQHLSDLHFLIANELPKKRLTSTDRQHDTETSSTWRRKCFHRNIYGRLRKTSTQASGPPEVCLNVCRGCKCVHTLSKRGVYAQALTPQCWTEKQLWAHFLCTCTEGQSTV